MPPSGPGLAGFRVQQVRRGTRGPIPVSFPGHRRGRCVIRVAENWQDEERAWREQRRPRLGRVADESAITGPAIGRTCDRQDLRSAGPALELRLGSSKPLAPIVQGNLPLLSGVARSLRWLIGVMRLIGGIPVPRINLRAPIRHGKRSGSSKWAGRAGNPR
jgi:hypothetical protein